MRSKTAFALVVVLAVLLSPQLTFATTGLKVQESGLQASIEANEIGVSVPVIAEGALPIVMNVSLLDPADTVVANGEASAILKLGANTLTLKLPYKAASSNKDVPWYRIRYVLTAKDTSRPLAEGIVSVGAVIPDLFDLRIIHQQTALEGSAYSVRVHAINPVTSAPASGVHIKATLTFDKKEASATPAVAVTNSSGMAVLHLPVPNKVQIDQGEVEIEARNARQIKTASFSVELNKYGQIIINTDKVLYQPGQSFHARALVFDASRRAIPDKAIQFVLEDPEGSTVYRTEGKTDNFGVATVDWNLPESLRLGDYRLNAEVADSDRYSGLRGSSTVG